MTEREFLNKNGRSRFKVFLEIAFFENLEKSLKNTFNVFIKDFRKFKSISSYSSKTLGKTFAKSTSR